ncbi:hypothetical protein NC653_027304 [Populus alba x Populus x berolinensis]|uniref:Uncharacterized protein n=1 Tax=Populus alba x Populus x berolinensis TaxID=444605 RepID=A0AAD6Q4W4_9ROSI|nr:hypothetical protein NC653_027304 [Populus alba x Populus x berolinensis]
MAGDPRCHHCPLEVESVMHDLRNCPTTHMIWNPIF